MHNPIISSYNKDNNKSRKMRKIYDLFYPAINSINRMDNSMFCDYVTKNIDFKIYFNDEDKENYKKIFYIDKYFFSFSILSNYLKFYFKSKNNTC